ncbi:transcriptional regulator with XRE-family HTH domain [Pseudomonas sp. OG7]|uniref:helix-turn-helix domain-containing protein n=1 Tax=Pseudomonas sp. OG7 TaxID=2587037 RepID=UPI00160A1EE3|nr:helix-turn-helix transcriptional regulator [Pseudomonas sp. OG7]MBB3272776.1 transcriptional regulator with XRE-family HTH domain [Pseudomonas sp. OG7]
MDNKLAFAAALRAVRATKGLTQEMVARFTSRPYVGRLEKGESSPSLDKLQALSEAMDVSPLTLLALSMAMQDDQPLAAITSRLKQELAAFEKAGGMKVLREQVINGELIPRPTGLPVNADNLAEVQRHKQAGYTQTETADRLGLSTSTVHDLWRREK